MDQIFFTYGKYHDKTDLFPKNQCKITIFTYVHSDWWWVDAGKMMKKLLFYPNGGKTFICIENLKFKI